MYYSKRSTRRISYALMLNPYCLKLTVYSLILTLLAVLSANAQPGSAQHGKLVNEPVDISGDFRDFSNTLFFADSLAAFDPATGVGKVKWRRNEPFQPITLITRC